MGLKYTKTSGFGQLCANHAFDMEMQDLRHGAALQEFLLLVVHVEFFPKLDDFFGKR
jgi:hypothetical protein